MIAIRKAAERGRTELGWLDSRHTFSFGDYHDPLHMGFSDLRVINDDRVQPGRGFGTHGHRDMEILTCVLEGSLQHKDSMGTGSVIREGDLQRMSAGTGVTHSEFNPSPVDLVRFLQIWILPDRTGVKPGYEQKHFPAGETRGRLRLAASPDGRDGSITIHQDASMYLADLEVGETVSHPVRPGRRVWAQVAQGAVTLDGQTLEEGDGAAVTDGTTVTLRGQEWSRIVLFDLR